MKIKNINIGLSTVFAFALAFGSVSLLVPEKTEAAGYYDNQYNSGNMHDFFGKFRVNKSYRQDIRDTNKYIRKYPEVGQDFRDLDNKFREKWKNVSSYRQAKNVGQQYHNEKRDLVAMYGGLYRKEQEIKALKARDYTKAPPGEPRGIDEVRRLAAVCGRGETVGYSNYFGDPSYYKKMYPLVASDFADLEQITVLRDHVLPKVNKDVMKFIADKQLNAISNTFINRRGNLYSDLHEQGGQKAYADKMLNQSRERHAERDVHRSEDMFRDLHKALDSFNYSFARNRPASGYMSRIERETDSLKIKSGTEILAECRYFWSRGNTLKEIPPDRGDGRFYTARERNVGVVGIQPNFVVAMPVRPTGKPVAKQNLNEAELNKSQDAKGVAERINQYGERLTIEDKNESADDIMKRTYGDDFKDPSSFKIIEGGMGINNGNNREYQINRSEQGMRNFEKNTYDQRNGTQNTQQLNFNDLYN